MQARSADSNMFPYNDYLLTSKAVYSHRSAPTDYLSTIRNVTNICWQERLWGKWLSFCYGGCWGEEKLSDWIQQALDLTLGRNLNCYIILPGEGCDRAVPREVTFLEVSDRNYLVEGKIQFPVTYIWQTRHTVFSYIFLNKYNKNDRLPSYSFHPSRSKKYFTNTDSVTHVTAYTVILSTFLITL